MIAIASCTRPSALAAAPGQAAAAAAILPPTARRPATARCRRRALLPVQATLGSSNDVPPVAAAVEAPLQVLREACRTKQVPPEQVLAAMQQVEAAHKQSSLVQGVPLQRQGRRTELPNPLVG